LTGLAMALAGQGRAYDALRLAGAVAARRSTQGSDPHVPFWEELQQDYFGRRPRRTRRTGRRRGPAARRGSRGRGPNRGTHRLLCGTGATKPRARNQPCAHGADAAGVAIRLTNQTTRADYENCEDRTQRQTRSYCRPCATVCCCK
jgi:hypothetical protein